MKILEKEKLIQKINEQENLGALLGIYEAYLDKMGIPTVEFTRQALEMLFINMGLEKVKNNFIEIINNPDVNSLRPKEHKILNL